MKPMNNYLIFPVGPSNKSISTSYLPVHFFIIRNIALNATSIGPSGPSIVGLATTVWRDMIITVLGWPFA